MATVYDVIQQYRPELELKETVSTEEAIQYLVEEEELDAATVREVFEGLTAMLFWFLVRGRPVKLPGLGSIKPVIDLDGTIHAQIDTHPDLVSEMNEPEAYRAGIKRKENIGLDLDQLIEKWNSSHPNQQI